MQAILGKPEILQELSALAPVIAIRGNNDTGTWAETIPEVETISVESISIYLLHIVKELNLDPKTANIQVVISGHSHKPSYRGARRCAVSESRQCRISKI